MLEATLVLGTEAAASSCLGESSRKDAVELSGSSPGQESFSPQDGQNLKLGCSFVPHWGQKWKGILQKKNTHTPNLYLIGVVCLCHSYQRNTHSLANLEKST